jgi:hypothetical protein
MSRETGLVPKYVKQSKIITGEALRVTEIEAVRFPDNLHLRKGNLN